MGRARHQVTVAMAYFGPVAMVLRALLRARRRRVGVGVRVIVLVNRVARMERRWW